MLEDKTIQWEDNQDDDIMVDTIDSTLAYLDEECEFFSEPITVKDMRQWLRDKFYHEKSFITEKVENRWKSKDETDKTIQEN